MEKSSVYFSQVSSRDIRERIAALKKLLEQWNPFANIKKGEIVPVKLTIGDRDCRYNIQPELVKAVVDELLAKKARPFLFDTNVIYPGSRQNAVDHLNLVYAKGFTHANVGAPFIIADGVFGGDGRQYAINAKHLETIKTPSFVGMLDTLVVLSHVTGHILSGYGGAIKNVAMGMSSRAGKQVQHSAFRPHVIEKKCASCGCCIEICPAKAVSVKDEKSWIDKSKCLGCGECIAACRHDAIYINWKEDPLIFDKKMAECSKAILSKFKNHIFINFALDMTKNCDCVIGPEEHPISEDVGVIGSGDIVSVEKATIDLINKEGDIFVKAGGSGVYHEKIKYAAEIGMGSLSYEIK